MSTFNFYTDDKAYGELYLQFPEVFLYSEKYKNLSNDAKMAYMVFKNRLRYSIKNDWIDEDRNVYFIFTIKELCSLLNTSKPTVIKIKKELEEANLLLQVKQGFNAKKKRNEPNRLYLADLEVEAHEVYSFQNMERTLSEQGSKNSLPRQKHEETLSDQGGQNSLPREGVSEISSEQGSKNSLPRQKHEETLSNQGSKDSLPNLYKELGSKDIKDTKDSYVSENDVFQQANDHLHHDSEYNSQLIDTLIEREGIESRFGAYILQNMRHYAKGDFVTFRLFWEKLKYAHVGAEKEIGAVISVNDYWVTDPEEYERQLSKTFWRVCEANASNQIKSNFSGYLFLSLKNSFVSIYDQQQDSNPVSLHNWLE